MLEGPEDILFTGVRRNTMGGDSSIPWRDSAGVSQTRLVAGCAVTSPAAVEVT